MSMSKQSRWLKGLVSPGDLLVAGRGRLGGVAAFGWAHGLWVFAAVGLRSARRLGFLRLRDPCRRHRQLAGGPPRLRGVLVGWGLGGASGQRTGGHADHALFPHSRIGGDEVTRAVGPSPDGRRRGALGGLAAVGAGLAALACCGLLPVLGATLVAVGVAWWWGGAVVGLVAVAVAVVVLGRRRRGTRGGLLDPGFADE